MPQALPVAGEPTMWFSCGELPLGAGAAPRAGRALLLKLIPRVGSWGRSVGRSQVGAGCRGEGATWLKGRVSAAFNLRLGFFLSAVLELLVGLLRLCAPGYQGCARRLSPWLQWETAHADPVCRLGKVNLIF